MDRAFLEEQGLEKEVIDKVMAEYGKSVQQTKEQITNLTEQITSLNEKVTEGEATIANVKEQYKDYDAIVAERDKYMAERDDVQARYTKDTKKNALVNEAIKQGVIDAEDITKYVDVEKLTIDDNGKVVGLDSVEKLKAEKPYLFAQPKKHATGEPHDEPKETVDNDVRRAMGLPPII